MIMLNKFSFFQWFFAFQFLAQRFNFAPRFMNVFSLKKISLFVVDFEKDQKDSLRMTRSVNLWL